MQQQDSKRVIATLERFGCEGDCPIYKLSIYEDGSLEFRGAIGVKERGHTKRAVLSAKELAALKTAFATAHYFELPTRFDCGDDGAVAGLFFSDRKKQRSIKHDRLCDHHGGTTKVMIQAKTLTALEQEIHRIANTSRWLK